MTHRNMSGHYHEIPLAPGLLRCPSIFKPSKQDINVVYKPLDCKMKLVLLFLLLLLFLYVIFILLLLLPLLLH